MTAETRGTSYVIGLDFGSDSARSILVDCRDGAILSSFVHPYARWAGRQWCDPALRQVRQHPLDYAEALEAVLSAAVSACPDPKAVRGISVDATASTPCLVDRNLQPLALRPEFSDDPDAMFLLWKDHSAEEEASQLQRLCAESHADWLRNNGGICSPELFWPKVLHLWRTAPHLREAAWTALEAGDWLTALLTGCRSAEQFGASLNLARAKHFFSRGDAYPSLFPSGSKGPVSWAAHMPRRHLGCAATAGMLRPDWAARLGLSDRVAVGVAEVDSFSGASGAGIAPGTAVMNLGTSACVLTELPLGGELEFRDVFSVADQAFSDSTVGVEAGTSAFGDLFAWCCRLLAWSPEGPRSTEGLMDALSRAAGALSVTPDSPMVTDCFNGRRTPEADGTMTGTLAGLRLDTDVPQLYYALVEGACFSIRAILDAWHRQGILLSRHVAVGGIPQKAPFVMQTLSNVLGERIEVAPTAHSSALGAAVHAACAAGLFGSPEEARLRLCPAPTRHYDPDPSVRALLHERYTRWRALARLSRHPSVD